MKLHSTIIGEGTPFLILHGFLGMSDNWKTLGRQFSNTGYQVHLIDQRNHGRSPHSVEFSYLEMAKDLEEYCQEHSLEKCILLGHSMGGKTAMFTASLFPQLVDKLIVVDIAPRYYGPHHQEILKGLQAVEQAELASRSDADEVLSKFVKEEAVRLFLLKNLYWKERTRLALRLNLDVLTENVESLGQGVPSERTFSKSTLFIKGGNSDYISEEDRDTIAKQFPSSRVEVIPDAGHWVHAEKRKVFYQTVMDFL